jgi:retron-type reverse transcriptase
MEKKIQNFYMKKLKKNQANTRSLTVAFLTEKNVLEAIRIIPEVIYEPIFLSISHGFRPFHLCHSASQLGLGCKTTTRL